MGKRGPQPKPAWLRVLDGNPGKRTTAEILPSIPVSRLEAPAHFGLKHLEIWNRVCDTLASVNGLTERDALALARYVDFSVIYHSAREFIENAGGNLVYPIKQVVHEKDDATGKVVKREVTRSLRSLPQWKQMLEASNHMMKFEAQFGLNPTSRIGTGTGGGDDGLDIDPFA